MRLLYDHQTFSLQKYGGISRYFSELIHGINATTSHEAYLSLLCTNNVYAHDLNLAKTYFFPGIEFSKKIISIIQIEQGGINYRFND